MTTRAIMTPEQADALCKWLVGLPMPFTVTVKDGVARTLSQNALLWKWNHEIAAWRGDVTGREVHRENKFLIGCAILVRDDDDFAQAVQKLSSMTYEEKLEFMDYLSVTSIMTQKQMSEFMDTVYRKFTEKGCAMTLPAPEGEAYEQEMSDD